MEKKTHCRLRTAFILLFFVLKVQGTLLSQTVFKINQYNTLYNGDVMPVLTLFTNHAISPKFSATGYFYVNAYEKNSWGEGLIGATYTPWKGISAGFLAGLQSNETKIWRISPIFFISKKRFLAMGALEFGGKRYRWDIMAFYTLKPFLLGAEFIRYYQMYAIGPRIEFSFLKAQPIYLFHTSLWDWVNNRYGAMFGIYTTFGQKKQN